MFLYSLGLIYVTAAVTTGVLGYMWAVSQSAEKAKQYLAAAKYGVAWPYSLVRTGIDLYRFHRYRRAAEAEMRDLQERLSALMSNAGTAEEQEVVVREELN